MKIKKCESDNPQTNLPQSDVLEGPSGINIAIRHAKDSVPKEPRKSMKPMTALKSLKTKYDKQNTVSTQITITEKICLK